MATEGGSLEKSAELSLSATFTRRSGEDDGRTAQ